MSRKAKKARVTADEKALLRGLSTGPIYARAIHPWEEAPQVDAHDRRMHALVEKGLAKPEPPSHYSSKNLPRFHITSQGREIAETEDAAWRQRLLDTYERRSKHTKVTHTR